MKPTFFTRFKRAGAYGFAVLLALVGLATSAHAGALTNKSLKLSDSTRSHASTSYLFTFTGQAAVVHCVKLTFSTTQGGAGSSSAAGVTSPGSPTVTNLGSGGTWASANPSTGVVTVTNATNTGNAASGSTVTLPTITNSATTGTYFVRIATFGNTDCSTTPLDSDDVAFVVGDTTNTSQDTSVAVTGSLGETLTLTLSATSANLGTLNSGNICTSGSGSCPTHTLTVSTNAANGYTVYATGTTLTNGTQNIAYVADGAVTAGASEFGLAFSGVTAGATAPSNDNGVGSQTNVLTRSAPTSGDSETVTYKASVTATQAPGTYTSTVNYVATGQF